MTPIFSGANFLIETYNPMKINGLAYSCTSVVNYLYLVYYIYKEKLLRKSSSVNGRKPFQSSCHFLGIFFKQKKTKKKKETQQKYEKNKNSSNNNNNNNHNIIKIEEERKKEKKNRKLATGTCVRGETSESRGEQPRLELK